MADIAEETPTSNFESSSREPGNALK